MNWLLRWTACLLPCLLVLAFPAAGAGSTDVVSGEIVFVTNHYCGQVDCGRGDIAVIDPDGSGLRVLTWLPSTTRVSEYSPKWSPDRRQIAYVRPVKGQPNARQIWLMAADGSHKRQLTHLPPKGSLQLFGGDGTAIDWAPDGRRLVFADGPSGNLYVVNADTGAVKLLRKTPYYWVTEAAWSPDGRWIVFVENPRGGGEASQLIRYSPTTQHFRQLTHLPSSVGVTANPAWSPDSHEIAFVGNGLRVIDVDGTHLRSLKTWGIEPTWSPDGEWMAYTTGADLGVMRADRFSRHLITHVSTANNWADYEPDW